MIMKRKYFKSKRQKPSRIR